MWPATSQVFNRPICHRVSGVVSYPRPHFLLPNSMAAVAHEHLCLESFGRLSFLLLFSFHFFLLVVFRIESRALN